MYKVKLYVTLKKQVLDPQGLTVKHALESLGHTDVEEVRMGKLIEISSRSKDKANLEKEIARMCERLLVNPVIEEYSYEVEEEK